MYLYLLSGASTAAITAILLRIFIPKLRSLKLGQPIYDIGPRWHKSKEGTPTMGGLIFIIPTILSIVILLLWNKIEFSANLFIVLFVFLSYALLGFIDDYLIIKRKNYDVK